MTVADTDYKCEDCGAIYRRPDGLKYHKEHLCPTLGLWGAPPSQTTPTAAEIAETAAKLVGGDRQVTHGDKSINFKNTADAWNAILGMKERQCNYTDCGNCSCKTITAYDVANMLEALKIARRYSGAFNLDDHVDGAGYAACGGEIGAKMFSQ